MTGRPRVTRLEIENGGAARCPRCRLQLLRGTVIVNSTFVVRHWCGAHVMIAAGAAREEL